MFILYRRGFRGATKSSPVQYEQQRPGAAQVVHTHQTLIMPKRLVDKVWCTKFQSLLLNIYFRLNGFQSSLLLIYFRNSPNRCSQCIKVWHRTYRMSRSTFEIGVAKLRTVTEIVPPQPFMCANKSPIRCHFRSGSN